MPRSRSGAGWLSAEWSPLQISRTSSSVLIIRGGRILSCGRPSYRIFPTHKNTLPLTESCKRKGVELNILLSRRLQHIRTGKTAISRYSAQHLKHFFSVRTQLAVLSEVLNGTDHLRGVGVLVVVPRHDLNLIGVVAATLNFCTSPSSSSQFRNNSYSTTAYRCRTKTGLFVPQLYHVSASFARFPSISHPTCIFLILGSLFSRNT